MRYHPYESYYQPEVDWLDDIPSHWEVLRTKTMLSLQKSKVGRSASEYMLLSLTLGGVVPRDISEGGKFPAEFDTYQIVEPDDLVFCLFDIDETPRTIGIARDDGMITGAYSVYRAHGPCVPEYVYYYFLHIDSFKGLRPFYTGLRKVVRADTFSKVEMPVPPQKEQTQIAKFLDYETGKMDALIEKQQQLIRLLKEKRQAVISHAVTKGLNPAVPMRDSGIAWLGEVPAHWEVVSIGRKIRLCRGVDITKDKQREGTVPVVSSGGIASFHDTATCTGPGVVVGRKGTAGKVYFIEQDFWAHDTTLFVEKFHGNAQKFVFYKLLSMNLSRFDTGSANPTLNRNVVHPEKVSWPPVEEQHDIVEYLDSFCRLTGKISVQAKGMNDLLQERRTALISAAVTGKIDVRNWKPPAPRNQTETP